MDEPFIDVEYFWGALQAVLPYVKVTLGLTLASVVLGAILGLVCCLVEVRKVPVLSQLAKLYVLVCRSLPNMVLLYLVYYGVPILLMALSREGNLPLHVEKVTALQIAVVGLTLHTGAYLTEIFRAAVQSIPAGQLEAAESIGMTWLQAYRRVILPQAAVFSLPLFANQFLSTMKSTSIVFVITVIELFGAAKLYCEDNSQYLEAYIAVACIYWVMGVVFEFLFDRLELRLGRYKRGNVA
ncbi:amino acid ABC transporter permease [Acidaminococcus timonensis]|uniref:amino acid ABC transporter permease n=1 Tax=Acidaminococcus timonensis TaxID=1871002 RepID=UPI0026F2FEE7|nr:amino acid ABC transporter permease [Acidaminococcus timonensis]